MSQPRQKSQSIPAKYTFDGAKALAAWQKGKQARRLFYDPPGRQWRRDRGGILLEIDVKVTQLFTFYLQPARGPEAVDQCGIFCGIATPGVIGDQYV